MGLERYVPKGPLQLIEPWVFPGNCCWGDCLEVGPLSRFGVGNRIGGQRHSSMGPIRSSGENDFGLGGLKSFRERGVPE